MKYNGSNFNEHHHRRTRANMAKLNIYELSARSNIALIQKYRDFQIFKLPETARLKRLKID